MDNTITAWQILFIFEIILFSSYTAIMYIYSKKTEISSGVTDIPPVTLIIPMYNEEKVIAEKIENAAGLDYPREKLEIILLDDHSTDSSRNISLNAIEKHGLNASVVESRGGKGKARALNWIFPQLKSEITVISDADALIRSDALLQLVRNYSDPEVGGVTGKIVILSDKTRFSSTQEDSYRYFFDIWRLGESNIGSVSVCNGPLMSFRTELLNKLTIDPDAYADDSDMLFKVLRMGYRVVYDPTAVVYERVPLSIKGRTVQKMKRINGLRKVYLNNLDMLGRGRFGQVIYPFALLTHIISPIILLFLVLLFPVVVMKNTLYLVLLLFFLIPGIGGTLFSFVTTQLIINFSFLVHTSGSWTAVKDARYSLQKNDQ